MFRCLCFPQVVQKQMFGEVGNLRGQFSCQLSEQYSYQKLSKLDNLLSYNRKCRGCFWDTV